MPWPLPLNTLSSPCRPPDLPTKPLAGIPYTRPRSRDHDIDRISDPMSDPDSDMDQNHNANLGIDVDFDPEPSQDLQEIRVSRRRAQNHAKPLPSKPLPEASWMKGHVMSRALLFPNLNSIGNRAPVLRDSSIQLDSHFNSAPFAKNRIASSGNDFGSEHGLHMNARHVSGKVAEEGRATRYDCNT